MAVASSSKAPAVKVAKVKKVPSIRYGGDFHRALEGAQLDPELLKRTLELCEFLIASDLVTGSIVYNQGVRSRAKAHLWSTAYNIRMGRVPLANLRALRDGKDEDGNLWFDPAWEKGLETESKGKLTKASENALLELAKKNAYRIWTGKVAAEGYPLSNSRSKPNVHKAVSNHVDGKAIDISISWKANAAVPELSGGGKIVNGENTDSVANRLVASFGLSRPVQSERWHFQLGEARDRNFSRENNLNGFFLQRGSPTLRCLPA